MPLTLQQLNELSNKIQALQLTVDEQMKNAADPFSIEQTPELIELRDLHDQYGAAFYPELQELIEQMAAGLVTVHEFVMSVIGRAGAIPQQQN